MTARHDLCYGPMKPAPVRHAFGDICRDSSCATCAIWQRPNETRDQWQTRVREMFDAAPFQHERESVA